MEVRRDASALEQSGRVVLPLQDLYLENLVRAVSPAFVKSSADILQMAQTMAIHVYGSYPPLASDFVLSVWTMSPPQQVDQHFNVASDSSTTKTNHYHPQWDHISSALKLNPTCNLDNLQCLCHTSTLYTQYQAGFTVQSKWQTMVYTAFAQWVEHGPKPKPEPKPKPRPSQPRPIPSV